MKGLDTIKAGPNGEYKFEYTSDLPEFYRVGTNEQNSFYLVLEPGGKCRSQCQRIKTYSKRMKLSRHLKSVIE